MNRTPAPIAPHERPLIFPALALSMLCSTVLFLSACAGDSVENRRTGQMIVCHKGDKTLAVSNASSFVHLDHGDSPGPCPEEDEADRSAKNND